jgi:CRISPR/Cas system-associated exonuclease Cas4 (RecB family)
MATTSQYNESMTYFLEDVARFLLDSNKGDLRNLVVVFPNRRARLFFNKYLSQLTKDPLWAPRYYTVSDFIQQLSGLRLADPLTLLFSLFKVFKEVTGSDETFDRFYYYCETVLADFDDIDKYRVDAGMIYQNLSDLNSIESYYEFLSKSQVDAIRQFWDIYITSRDSLEKDKFTSLWDSLKQIYIRFNEQLDAKKIAYEGKIYREAVDNLEDSEFNIFRGKTIAFVGFNALNNCEELLFEYFNKQGNALFFWDFDETYLNSDIHEAGFFLRKYIRRFLPPDSFKTKSNFSDPKVKVTTVAVPSDISQAKVIKFCLEMNKTKDRDNPGKTALILADENLLLPVVNSLPTDINKVNISMGYPVIDTPAYSFISALADLQINKRKNRTTDLFEYYHKDYFALLNHVYLARLRKNSGFAEFQRNVAEKNLVYINPSNFSVDETIYKEIFTAVEEPVSFGSYLTAILKIIARHVMEQEDEKPEIQWHLGILHGIYKVLVRYETLISEIDITFSFQTAINLLRKILKGITIPFSGEPLTGFQIMGILETRTLDFENCIILSMNEGIFPKAGHVPSMIPFSLRFGFGLPTVQHQDAIYGYYFYRLLHRARNMVLVYNTRTEGLQKGEPSRFIYQLQYDSVFNIDEVNLGYKVSPFPLKKISALNSENVVKSLSRFLSPGASSYMSPSAINTYLNCKLRFYFKYVEGMQEPENIDEEIENNVFGSIIHKTMEILYQPYIGKLVLVEDIDKIFLNKKMIGEVIDRSFAEEYFAKPSLLTGDLSGRNLIIRKVIEKYIDGILSYDRISAPFKILSLEKEYTLELLSSKTGRKVKLGGYIDRLDEKEGKIRVIDYKTGNIKDEFKNIDDLFESPPTKRNQAVFQTFLYSLILKNKDYSTITPALFFLRNICKPDFDYQIYRVENRVKNQVSDFNEYALDFEGKLKSLIDEIFDPEISFTQTDDARFCLNCPYNTICMRKA